MSTCPDLIRDRNPVLGNDHAQLDGQFTSSHITSRTRDAMRCKTRPPSAPLAEAVVVCGIGKKKAYAALGIARGWRSAKSGHSWIDFIECQSTWRLLSLPRGYGERSQKHL